ncbi:MAG: threonine ammonia-lyase [Sphaerochaetaceae bacterium]|nr:threonine ammonia-lyase [Sphaerochaetaceae bacterium]
MEFGNWLWYNGRMDVCFEMVSDAVITLQGKARKTPILSSAFLGENLFLKAENLQKTGSFKFRGSLNKIQSLSDDELSHGIIACSSGNHAQGVALAASKIGIKSIICMSERASKQKINATKSYGGEVLLVPGSYDDAAKKAEELRKENGYTLVHPFNDPFVIAGQGTIGVEIAEQVPDVQQILVPVGGGGLISGIALAIKTLKPCCKVIGVQAANVPSMFSSMAARKIVSVKENKETLADGIHVLTPGDITFAMVNKYVDDIVTVSEKEIMDAMVKLLAYSKTVVEGAGAVSVAAFLSDKVDKNLKTVCVVSGGNVDLEVLNTAISIESGLI